MKKDFISLVILLTLQYVSGRTFVPKSTVPQQQNNNRNAVTRTNVPSVETSREVGRGGAKVSGGTASISNEIFNLVKGIVGAGVLSLPAGIAAFGDAPSAVLPALALIAVIGTLSAYGFSIIGRVCKYYNVGQKLCSFISISLSHTNTHHRCLHRCNFTERCLESIRQ